MEGVILQHHVHLVKYLADALRNPKQLDGRFDTAPRTRYKSTR